MISLLPTHAVHSTTKEHGDCRGRPRSHLLGLPIELMQQIFSHLYHPPSMQQRPCEVSHGRLGNLGCRCGDSLSTTCKQLYLQLRRRVFNCARFNFASPEVCERYLTKIGHLRNQIGSLELTYTNTVGDSGQLAEVFKYLVQSEKLLHLRLIIHGTDGQSPSSYPMYVPTQVIYTDAQLWDATYRPSSHPLAHLKAVQKLTIIGHPGAGEMEEVFFKARMNVELVIRTLLEQVPATLSSWDFTNPNPKFVVGAAPWETLEFHP